jgi:hypothetical protein
MAERFASGTHAFEEATLATRGRPSEMPECDFEDDALEHVALRLAHREALGLPPPSSPELTFSLRASGSPHVWPRGWTLSNTPEPSDAENRLRSFVRSVPREGRRGCGIATTSDRNGKAVRAAVVVDALATMAPLPTTARVGAWLPLSARMLVPLAGASVVVLGPSGAPRSVPSNVRDERIDARIHVDQPGLWTIQVVATLGSGPRPVLEALVAVDSLPPETYVAVPAPGEARLVPGEAPEAALFRLVDAARRSEGLDGLARSARLDALAQQHAESMRAAGRLSHDVGRGGPAERLRAAGLDLAVLGENVARAEDASRANRSLWASPSHRGNILDHRFNTVGVGTVRGRDGTLWVCELFANFASTGITGTGR